MTFNIRNQFKRMIATSLLQRLREYNELPPDAQRAWWVSLCVRKATGRDITRLPSTLPERPHVLLVCYGNIYRSPYALSLLRDALASHPQIRATMSSGGLISTSGRSSPEEAQSLAAARGTDISTHRSVQITAEHVATADVIVLMDRRNEALLRARFPAHQHKLVLLGAFDPLTPTLGPTISDPYGRGEEALEACFSRIERCIHRLVAALEGRNQMKPPTLLKRAARRAANARLLLPVWSRLSNNAATILMLHRFEDRDAGTWGHSPDLLALHLEFLRAHRYQILGLDELVQRSQAGEPVPENTVVFTVDDGYADFARIGAPLFERFDVPVTLFITTRFVDGDHWQWYDAVAHLCATRERARITLGEGPESIQVGWTDPRERTRAVRLVVQKMKALPMGAIHRHMASLAEILEAKLPPRPTSRFAAIGWRDVKNLSSRGVRFGGHTKTHVILAHEADEDAHNEIVDSIETVRRRSPNPSAVFAYPNGLPGDFGAREEKWVASAGCIGAVASFGGHCSSGAMRNRPFAIPRLPYSDDLQEMRMSLLGIDRLGSSRRATSRL